MIQKFSEKVFAILKRTVAECFYISIEKCESCTDWKARVSHFSLREYLRQLRHTIKLGYGLIWKILIKKRSYVNIHKYKRTENR